MGIAAYYHSVLPYYYYPGVLGKGDEQEPETAEAAAMLPSVQRLYQEYQQLIAGGMRPTAAKTVVCDRNPEAASLFESVLRMLGDPKHKKETHAHGHHQR